MYNIIGKPIYQILKHKQHSIPALSEAQEELQAQILTRGVEEGRSLLDGVSGPLVAGNSLAHELSQMSDDEVRNNISYIIENKINVIRIYFSIAKNIIIDFIVVSQYKKSN